MPKTPPISILASLFFLLVCGLKDLLEYLPLLASAISIRYMPILAHLIDLVILVSLMSLIFSMPMSPGGWDAVVDEEERKRVLAGTIVEETEDMAENYEVSNDSHIFVDTTHSHRNLRIPISYVQRPLKTTRPWAPR